MMAIAIVTGRPEMMSWVSSQPPRVASRRGGPAGMSAKHFEGLRVGPGYEYEDLYGRVLELDPETGHIRVYINGGTALSDPAKNFSNPDGIETLRLEGKDWLVINEDLNGRSANRVSDDAAAAGRTVGEIYVVDASIPNPKVDNLKRLLIGPNGAETTGGKATPDGRTYFVNIQHPSGSNPEPFNRSATIAVTGFAPLIDADLSVGDDVEATRFRVFPNPTTGRVELSKQTDVAIYTGAGERVQVIPNARVISFHGYAPGVYLIQTREGQVAKVVVE